MTALSLLDFALAACFLAGMACGAWLRWFYTETK